MKLSSILRLSGADRIARRYFVVNSFDGILTSLGIIVGVFAGGVAEPAVIIVAVAGASIALAVSGTSSAYITEEAEDKSSMRTVERAMLKDLSKTSIGMATSKSPLLVGLINGLSPALASFLILIPSILAAMGALPVRYLFVTSIIVAFTLLIFLGVYLGRVAKEKAWLYALKTVGIGAIALICTSVIRLF